MSANTTNYSRENAYYGMYLNMARHNAFLIINHISSKYDLTLLTDDEHIEESDKVKLLKAETFTQKPHEESNILEALYEYFPWLNLIEVALTAEKPYKDPQKAATPNPRAESLLRVKADFVKRYPNKSVREIVCAELLSAFALLSNLRNKYSHHYSTTPHEYPFEIQPYYDDALNFVTRPMDAQNKPNLYKFENLTWLHLTNENEIAKKVPHRGKDKTLSSINHKWVTFFCCLFLERTDAYKFLDKLEGFHDKRGDFKATLSLYTLHCCKMPYPKLESSDIALDMLNELGRVPQKLFPLLHYDDVLILKAQADEPDANEPNKPDSDAYIKRHGDRSNYFILRYFDDYNVFKDMRFQIRIGRRRLPQTEIIEEKKQYKKDKEGNLIYSDQNIKVVNRFGKLSEFSDLPAEWQIQVGTNDDDSSIHIMEHFAPHYHFLYEDKNVVALKLFVSNKGWGKIEDNTELGDALLSTHELPNLFLLSMWGDGAEAVKIVQAYIKGFKALIKDLKAGTFIPITNKELKKRRVYNEREQETLKRLHDELDTRLKKYNLKYTYLPDAIKQYLLRYSEKSYFDLVSELITRDKKEVTKQHENAEKGKFPKKFEDIVEFLRKDIIKLQAQGENGIGKLNRIQSRTLTKRLVAFATEKFQLSEFFYDTGLIGGTYPHPFLANIDLKQCSHTRDFYAQYLKYRHTWIEAIEKELKDCTNNQNEMEGFRARYQHVFKVKNRMKPSDKDKFTNYDKVPIALPRGLFNARILEVMPAAEKEKIKDLNLTKPSDIIRAITDKDCQPFYDFEPYVKVKNYKAKPDNDEEPYYSKRFVDRLNTLINNAKEGKENLANDKSLEGMKLLQAKGKQKTICEERNELEKLKKTIRYNLYTDRILRRVIEQILLKRKEIGSETTFEALPRLAAIEAFLKNPIPMRYTYELQKTPKRTIDITEQLPIRRYGQFRHLFKDRRLPDLLQAYWQKRTDEQAQDTTVKMQVTYARIKQELDDYDAGRADFMILVHQVETLIFEHYHSEFPMPTEKNGAKWYDHNAYLKVAYQHLQMDETRQQLLDEVKIAVLRNKFSHNQFPLRQEYRNLQIVIDFYPNLTTENDPDDQSQTFAKQMLTLATRQYEILRSLLIIPPLITA